jgi:uncharacterized protein (DUF58 family)
MSLSRHELWDKISAFRLTSSELAEDWRKGDFASGFRGEGIEADEVRLYEPGDDIRAIDANTSARFGKPYVKLYREERDLSVFILLDSSASMTGNSPRGVPTAYEQGVFAMAATAFSAEKLGLTNGALFFADKTLALFPPHRRLLRVILERAMEIHDAPTQRGTNLGAALKELSKVLRKRSRVIIISDFYCTAYEAE